jgi:hypothetical protein
MKLRAAVLLAALAAPALVAGCGMCFTGSNNPIMACDGQGALTQSGLSASKQTHPPEVASGLTCNSSGGVCSERPQFTITTFAGTSFMPDDFSVSFSFDQMQGPATFTLPSSSVQTDGSLEGNGADPFAPISGTVQVQGNTAEALVVELDVNFQSRSGRTFELAGRAIVTSCHIIGEMCTY